MLVYILVILLILFLRNNLYSIKKGLRRDNVEVKYLKIVCWILVLLAALRGSTVGTDTIGYIETYYLALPWYSFDETFFIYKDAPGFFLLAKVCSFLHFPIQILFGIVEGLYILSIYKFIRQYSSDKLFSVLCFSTIGLYAISLATLKQTLSMAFVLFYFLSLREGKYLKTLLLAIVAYYCHPASLIFLMGIMIYFFKNSRFFYHILIGVILSFGFGTTFVWSSLISILNDDHYSIYASDEVNYTAVTLIYYGVLLFCLFLFGKEYIKTKTEESKMLVGIAALCFATQFIASISSTAFRLAYYFLPFLIVALPNSFDYIRKVNDGNMIKTVVLLMVLFFYFYTNRNGGSTVPYRFFWQVWPVLNGVLT